MSASILFQPKSVSRILAVISAVCGCIIIIQGFVDISMSGIQSSTIQIAAFEVVLIFITGGVYFTLAVFLWKHQESKYIRLWAMLLCVLLFQPIVRFWGHVIYAAIKIFLTDTEAKILSTSCVLFFGLLSVGIIYVFLKRLLFLVYNKIEVVDFNIFKASRYVYFGFLTYTFWGMAIRVCLSITKSVTNSENENPVFLFMAFITGSVLSFGFFMLCRYLFVTRTIKMVSHN